MKCPSPTQQKVLDFIRAHQAERGFPPTLREMMKHFGWRSTNGAATHVNALEWKGYIVRKPGLARNITIVARDGEAPAPKPRVEVLEQVLTEARTELERLAREPTTPAVLAGQLLLVCDRLDDALAVRATFAG